MSYQHRLLAHAIGWKFNHQSGMTTTNGALTGWPTLPWPTDAELAHIVAEYDALPADDPAKDRKAALRKQIDQAVTLAELKAIVKAMV